MMQLNQLMKDSNYGLVINWKFHKQNKWVCAQTHYCSGSLLSTSISIKETLGVDCL